MAKTTMKFDDNFLKVKGQIAMGSQKALMAATIEWHKSVVKILQGTRSGRVYPVPGTGKVVDAEKTLANGRKFYYRKLEGAKYYTASAPGEPPASRLGDLRTSYRFVIKEYEGFVGTPLDYALALEKGTSEMAPRPHLTPAYMKNRKAIQAKFARDWL